MQYILLILIAICCFYFDSLLSLYNPFHIGGMDIYIVPHLLFMYVLVVAIYKDSKTAYIIAFLAGIFNDLYYSTVYGIYTFIFVFTVFIMTFMFRMFYRHIKTMLIIIIFLTFILDVYTYSMFRLVDLHHTSLMTFVWSKAVPSLILNALLLVILFPWIIKLLNVVKRISFNKEH